MNERNTVQATPEIHSAFVGDVCAIVEEGRKKAYNAVNNAMIETYWRVGQRIVEEEQRGKQRAEYGEQLINHLSARLTHDYGAGFSARYLRAFRKFYIIMPDMEIWKSRFPNLTWTHIFRSLRVGDDTAIRWYLQMASQEIPRMGNGDKEGGVQGLQRTHKHLHSPRVMNKRNRWKPVFQT